MFLGEYWLAALATWTIISVGTAILVGKIAHFGATGEV